MTNRMILGGLTLAAVTALSLSTAVRAQEGPEGGPGMGPMPVFNFDAMDADKDGKITQAELTAFRAAEAKAIDANADGKLDQAELVAMHTKMMTDRATDMATKMIERLDTDGDGALSVGEMAAKPLPAMIFDRIDADSDGAVTQVEIDAAREKMAERGGKHGKHGGPRGFWGFGNN